MKLFIRNLPYSTTELEIKAFFEECGECEAEVLLDNRGRSRGSAYATFTTEAATESALKKTGELLGGRVIKVEKASARKRNNNRRRNRQQQQQTGDEICFGYPVNQQIYIGNIGDMEEEEVAQMFMAFGYIIEVDIMRWRKSRIPKGFGFVIFDDAKSALNALSLDGAQCYGRRLRVKLAQAKKSYPKEAQPLPKPKHDSYKHHSPLYVPPNVYPGYEGGPVGFIEPQHAFIHQGYVEGETAPNAIAPMAGGLAQPTLAPLSPTEGNAPQSDRHPLQQAPPTQMQQIPALIAGFGNLSFQDRR